ncbi:hypothetical protein ScPMuIL_017719 [Solemya velum]
MRKKRTQDAEAYNLYYEQEKNCSKRRQRRTLAQIEREREYSIRMYISRTTRDENVFKSHACIIYKLSCRSHLPTSPGRDKLAGSSSIKTTSSGVLLMLDSCMARGS